MPTSWDNKKNLLCGILLGLLGFAGNWFKLELFFNVDFLFGSFFVMLAIICFGGTAGILAGAIAATCTFVLWNHPWAIIIMTAEAAFVAWRLRKDTSECLTADIMFWLVIGAPLVWLFYYHTLHLGTQSTLLIVLKQSINGIFNALLASAIHLIFRISGKNPDKYPSFQEILFITMVTIILIPSFVYLVLKLRQEMQVGQEQIRETAFHTAASARSSLDQWLKGHHQDIELLATLVGSPQSASPMQMQQLVEKIRMTSPEFLKMGVLDHKAVTVAYSPLVENGLSNIGISFADRSYIQLLKDTRRPYVHDMVLGKLGAKVPILPLLVPISDGGRYAGYCAGVVDLTQMKRLLTEHVTPQFENITILDRNSNVVISTRDEVKAMEHFARPGGATVQKIAEGYYHWIPEIKKGASVMSRWMGSLYVHESAVSTELPWKVITEISPRPMLGKLSASSINAFLMMATIIVLSSLFARFISRSYVKSLQILQQETRQIPEVFDDQLPVLPTHSSRIKELYRLNENFHQMTQLLHDRMREIRTANQARLVSAEAEKKHLHEKEMLVKDLHDGIGGLITKISMLAQYANSARQLDTYADVMDKILDLAYEGNIEVRSFMNSLESDQPAWGDLLSEITEHCERMFERSSMIHSITSTIGPDAPGVGVFRYVNIVRIFRETVANIIKHAEAKKVGITFAVTKEGFTLVVSDDGVGYDATAVRKRGVANMYSRAGHLGGKLFIKSFPPGGTVVTITIPLGESEMELQCV
jgi:signal transduction histidine kinase/sensor domain CHASE-containing protein